MIIKALSLRTINYTIKIIVFNDSLSHSYSVLISFERKVNSYFTGTGV